MKRIWLMVAGIVLAGSLVQAQDDDTLPAELEGDVEQWIVEIGLANKSYLTWHSALQHRADAQYAMSENWEQGDISGSGWGLLLKAAKGGGALVVTYFGTDMDYEYYDPNGRGSHFLEHERSDLELLWQQESGSTDDSHWGWMAGYRYFGYTTTMQINEGGNTQTDSGDAQWNMVTVGYYGDIHPFGDEILVAYGSIGILLGEVSGMARRDSDEEYDGSIEDQYGQESSVAYGASVKLGACVALTGAIHLGVEYNREWMYSFDEVASRDSVLVFPDNYDAQFLENHQGISAYLKAIW